MDRKAFAIAFGIGLLAQLAMVIAGHFIPVIRDKGFMIGGLAISAVAGLLYARLAASIRWPSALLDGGLAGGLCAFLAIGVSVLLRDTPQFILIAGTGSSVITGVIGGAIGRKLRPA